MKTIVKKEFIKGGYLITFSDNSKAFFPTQGLLK